MALNNCALVAVALKGAFAFPSISGDPCLCPAPHGLSCGNASNAKLAESDEGSASDKLQETWAAIMKNTQGRGFMNPAKTILWAENKDYLETMSTLPTENREAGHQKITHGIGGVAKVHFEWCKNSYTGMFQMADSCVIRIANAAAPSKSSFNPTSYGPNMAIKCYRDGATESANLLTIWEIDGYDVLPQGKQDSCSFFETPVANHCSKRDNITMPLKSVFIPAFERVDKRSTMLGTSPWAEASQDGTFVDKPLFPFALVFQPRPGLNDLPCEFDNVTSQLSHIGKKFKGKTLYEVFAVHDPWYSRPKGTPQPKHIGSMVLDSDFTTSMFGDTQLFFRHRFFSDELDMLKKTDAARAEAWDHYSDPGTTAGVDNVKVEGAAWYQPFLPASVESCGSASGGAREDATVIV